MTRLLISGYLEPEPGPESAVPILSGQGVRVYRNWLEFRSPGLRGAEAAILVLPQLREPTWSRVMQLRASRPALAMMLGTHYTRANARALASLELEELLFLDEVTERTLSASIGSLRCRSITRRAAAGLRRHEHAIDPEIAETLARACPHP